MKAKAVVDNQMGNVVIAPLLERNDNAYWVAIAQIDFIHQGAMKVAHVERYSKDHSEASPLLFPDGTFKMDVGPIEFKNDEDYDIYFDYRILKGEKFSLLLNAEIMNIGA